MLLCQKLKDYRNILSNYPTGKGENIEKNSWTVTHFFLNKTDIEEDSMKVNAFWWVIHCPELPNMKYKYQVYFRFIHPELKKGFHFNWILLYVLLILEL